jgi:uncharacterized coiled-coil protein SlyX
MNPLIQLKNATPVFLIALTCFGLLPMAPAVNPPPDGGYPNGNTAEGDNALFSLTTGFDNTAIGAQALLRNTTGDRNTAIGFQALFSNTAGNNTLGGNTAIGFRALYHHVGVVNANTAIGDSALFSNTTGGANTATGTRALTSNTTGFNNTANGIAALLFNTTGNFNTAIGANALIFTTSSWSTAIGDDALYSNTTGSENTAIGFSVLRGNTTGSFNTATGLQALLSNTTGHRNTAIGFKALRHNTTGSFNIGLGNLAGDNLTIGSNNIDIGNEGVAGESATIRIGTAGTHTATFIAGISGAPVINGVQVMVNPNGKLGTLVSSARFKEAIKPMDKASEALFALQPVTFRYKKEVDPASKPQFGLVAEDVEAVNPELVVRDKEGKPYAVRDHAVNAMLLNEFLKEHRKVQEQGAIIAQITSNAAKQEATIARQQKQIEALTAGLQKVSAQLEVSKPAPRTVLNNQ